MTDQHVDLLIIGAGPAGLAAAIAARDEQDSSRAVAPLKPAADAELVDNSDKTLEETFSYIYSKVKDAVL